MMTNESICIYNKFIDKETRSTKYQSIVIPKVYWEESKAANVIASGLENADSLKTIIPKSVIDNLDKKYVTPKEFKALSDYDRKDYFTLGIGDRITQGSNIYSIEELDKKVEAYTITKVDHKFFGSYYLQHVEIGAN